MSFLAWAWTEFWKVFQFQLDFAAAAIAVVALVVARRAARRQERLGIETLRVQRDNDVIEWSDRVIDTLVGIEFLLRDGPRFLDPRQFVLKRNVHLAEVSAHIDKGRMYFPNFARDVIPPDLPPIGAEERILDCLVKIYDLIRNATTEDLQALEKTRTLLLNRKREFVARAREEVDPLRRRQVLGMTARARTKP